MAIGGGQMGLVMDYQAAQGHDLDYTRPYDPHLRSGRLGTELDLVAQDAAHIGRFCPVPPTGRCVIAILVPPPGLLRLLPETFFSFLTSVGRCLFQGSSGLLP